MAGSTAFQPEPGDYVAVARGSFRRSLVRRRFILRAVIVLLLGLFGGIALNGGPASDGSLQAAALGLAAAGLWLGIILLGTFALIPRRTGRLFRQQRTLDDRSTFSWTDAGVVFGSDTGRSELAWNRYHGWFEDRRVFAFGLNEQLFHWTPKRVMDQDQIVDLRRTVEATGLARI